MRPIYNPSVPSHSVSISRQPLHLTLATSSRGFAARAFKCHEQSDWEGFVVNAGIAMELLAKSVLVR